MAGELAVVVVTSPILAHPSTALLETILSSLSLVAGLEDLQVLVVADGVKEGRFRPKRGEVPGEVVAGYRAYLDRCCTAHQAQGGGAGPGRRAPLEQGAPAEAALPPWLRPRRPRGAAPGAPPPGRSPPDQHPGLTYP